MNFKALGTAGKLISKGTLAVSASAVMAAGLLVNPWEGNENYVYFDVGNVATVCSGVTGHDYNGRGLIVGKYYSDAECDIMNSIALAEHEAELNKCIEVDVPAETRAALISFAYNVGPNAACRSTLMRKLNAGDIKGACEQLSRWVYVKGVKYRGLENRRFKGDATRISERTLCLIGLDKSYETPLSEKLMVDYKDWISGNEI